jgi:hypothetical protein
MPWPPPPLEQAERDRDGEAEHRGSVCKIASAFSMAVLGQPIVVALDRGQQGELRTDLLQQGVIFPYGRLQRCGADGVAKDRTGRRDVLPRFLQLLLPVEQLAGSSPRFRRSGPLAFGA